MKQYVIHASGGDTATPLNLAKRLNIIQEYLVPGKSKVLDGGCGEGDYILALRNQFQVEAWGIEYLEEKVNAFQSRHPHLDYVSKGDLEKLYYDDNTFDLVILNEVLEHVPDDKAALNESYRVLKPNGRIIIFSPNRLFPFESHGVYKINSNQKIPPYVPFIPYIPLPIGQKFFHYWARNYWPRELQKIVESANLKIEKTTYLWQTFENISRNQPNLIKNTKPLLRLISSTLEQTPIIKQFGLSQVIVAQKL